VQDNIFLKLITENEIRLTEYLHKIEELFKEGINIDDLLNAVSAGRAKPDVSLYSYAMESASKKGFYNAEVILLKNGKQIKGFAEDIEGVVNSSIKAAQAAIGEGRFVLNTNHPIEIRMVAHRIEGLVEVTIQVDDTGTGKTFIGSFVDYDIMGAAINAFIDAINQALDPETGSRGLEHSFKSLIHDPDTKNILNIDNNYVHFKEPPGKETIRAVFYMLSALHSSSEVPLYEIAIETIFQSVIKKTKRDPTSIITHTLETYSYVRAEAWDILKDLIHREETENVIIFHFREINRMLDAFDRLGSDHTRQLLTVLGVYFLDAIVEKAEDHIEHRLSDLAFVFENITAEQVEKLYGAYKIIRVGATRIILDGFRSSFAIRPAIDLIKNLTSIKIDDLKNSLSLLEKSSFLLSREDLVSALLKDFHWSLFFVLEITEKKLKKWKYLTEGRLSYLQEDLVILFNENPSQAVRDFRKIIEMDVEKVRKVLENGNLYVPLHNLEDFLKNKNLSFGQDSMCNYCESGAFHISIDEKQSLPGLMMREMRLTPPVAGIPELLGGNIVFDGWESSGLNKICDKKELSPIREIHNSGLADTFHKIGQKDEYKGPYPEKPALHRNKRGILIARDAVRQLYEDKYVITTGYGINLNTWIPFGYKDDKTTEISGYHVKPFGIGIKVHDVYSSGDNYLGSRLTLFTYDPYKKEMCNTRLLSRREADILAFILDYENLFSIVLRLAFFVREGMINEPLKWLKKVPSNLKDSVVKGEEGINSLSYHLKRLLFLPFVQDMFAKEGLFISYIKKAYPYLSRPKLTDPEKLIKDKKIGAKLILFFQKRKKRVKYFSSRDGFVVILPDFKKTRFGLYSRKGVSVIGTMLNSLPEYFSGKIFWGIPAKNGYYVSVMTCRNGKRGADNLLSGKELLNALINMENASEDLAKMAEGMKIQLSFSIENHHIFYGTRTIYGLKTRFFIDVKKHQKKRRGVYYVGKEIARGNVVTKGPVTTGWINVLEDENDLSSVNENDILVIRELKPGVKIELDKVNALVVEQGGPGSHSAIITKGKGITLLQNRGALNLLAPYNGEEVQIDPESGFIKLIQKTNRVYTGKKLKAIGALSGTVTAKIRYIERLNPNQSDEDYILLTNNLGKNIGRYFSDPHLEGIVSERGGALSRVIELAKEYLTIPVVTGFDVYYEKRIHDFIEDGMIVTINGTEGEIYTPKDTFDTAEYFYSRGDRATCLIVDAAGGERWSNYSELEAHSRAYMDELEKVLNKNTRGTTLQKLSHSKHTEIRVGVARHSNTPYKVLMELVRDPDISVRRTVLDRAVHSKKLTSEQRVDILEILFEKIKDMAAHKL